MFFLKKSGLICHTIKKINFEQTKMRYIINKVGLPYTKHAKGKPTKNIYKVLEYQSTSKKHYKKLETSTTITSILL